MTLLIIVLAAVSGALIAALICKGVQLDLWAEVIAGAGALMGSLGSLIMAGASAWPAYWIGIGFAAVVVGLRLQKQTS